MHNIYRECPQCGEPIEGRPNKKFCSDTCKGRHFRENNLPVDETNPAFVSQLPINPNTSGYYEVEEPKLNRKEEEYEERQKREATERKLRDEEKHVAELHSEFCEIVLKFLAIEGKTLTGRPVDRFLQQLERLTINYRQHPHLKAPNKLVRSRLKELYAIHDLLEEVAQEIASKILWQSKESHFELTNKWRKLLRELLIGD